MTIAAILLLGLALQQPEPSGPPAPAPRGAADAYLDAAAAELVRGARERTTSANREIAAYRMVARQRTSVGLQAFRRDRLLYRQERAVRVEWERDGPTRVEVLGAREVVPVVYREPRAGSAREVSRDAAGMVYDPDSEWLLRIPAGDDEEETSFRHPLAPGSEADYRFRSGETTTIRLPEGRTITLLELQVIPRRTEARLLVGSFWLDAESYAPARGVFKLAAPLRVTPRAGLGARIIPLPSASAELRYLTVEYGLWQGRWWLPRLIALEGVAAVGALNVPLVYEQSYEGYEVFAEGTRPAFADREGDPADDSEEFEIRSVSRRCVDDVCQEYEVRLPRDRGRLVDSDELPPSIYSAAGTLISAGELQQVAESLDAAARRALLQRPQLRWELPDRSATRYNRVEGLAVGGRVRLEMADRAMTAAASIGTAELSPSFEVEASRTRFARREHLAVYRRLQPFAERERPLGLGNSVSTLVLGRDDGDYYRALGVELGLTPWTGGSPAHGWRIFAERHSAVEKNTDFHFRNRTSAVELRPNPQADEADQFGVAGTVRLQRGLDPGRPRGGVAFDVRAEAGTFTLVRPGVEAYVGAPLGRRLLGMVEVGGGTSFGELPLQRLWHIGGPATVRGFAGETTLAGEAYWRARGEVGTALPAARLVVFTDAGWAGPLDGVTLTPALLSTGAGVSFLDGLLRADLARPLRGDRGWRLHLSIDAPL
jgi:hypothetical protein